MFVVILNGCKQEFIQDHLNNHKIDQSADDYRLLAKNLSTSNLLKELNHQNNGENLFLETKQLNNPEISLRSELNSLIDSILLENPTLTLAYPSLDYFPDETVNQHVQNLEFFTWLPQDYETTGTLEAYDTTGTLVSINALNFDTTARYCVIKESETYVALNEALGINNYGDPIPSAEVLAEIPAEYSINNWDIYFTQDIYNAFSYDLIFGDDTTVSASEFFDPNADILRAVIARNNYIFSTNNDISTRSSCDCTEFDWERDCEKEHENLYRINVRSRDATYALETFWAGPRLEFRAVYIYWDQQVNKPVDHTRTISIRRHLLHGKWPITNLTLPTWLKPREDDPFNLPVRWYEEPATFQLEEVETGYDKYKIAFKVKANSFYMGDYLIPYSDPYCTGEDYKVWAYPSHIPDDGFFFTQAKN